jgi:hypothetical protein
MAELKSLVDASYIKEISLVDLDKYCLNRELFSLKEINRPNPIKEAVKNINRPILAAYSQTFTIHTSYFDKLLDSQVKSWEASFELLYTRNVSYWDIDQNRYDFNFYLECLKIALYNRAISFRLYDLFIKYSFYVCKVNVASLYTAGLLSFDFLAYASTVNKKIVLV